MVANVFSTEDALAVIQQNFGTRDLSKLNVLRKQFWSYVAYPQAGAVETIFFGSASGTSGTNEQTTNMPKSGSFGDGHYLIKAIGCGIYIGANDLTLWDGLDSKALDNDIIMGFYNAGVFELKINSTFYAQIPEPFNFAPLWTGEPELFAGSIGALALTEGTPNLINTARFARLGAQPGSGRDQAYRLDPNLLITIDQTFQAAIRFPSGAVPVIATGIVPDDTTLYIGVEFDGVFIRPTQ